MPAILVVMLLCDNWQELHLYQGQRTAPHGILDICVTKGFINWSTYAIYLPSVSYWIIIAIDSCIETTLISVLSYSYFALDESELYYALF